MVTKILQSIGSVISIKKDCLKTCDHPKKYKSQIRGGFSGNAIFTVLEVLYPSKKTASKYAISLNHKTQMEGGFGGKMIFTKFWNSNFLQIRQPKKV